MSETVNVLQAIPPTCVTKKIAGAEGRRSFVVDDRVFGARAGLAAKMTGAVNFVSSLVDHLNFGG
jgi:hypothetical protein